MLVSLMLQLARSVCISGTEANACCVLLSKRHSRVLSGVGDTMLLATCAISYANMFLLDSVVSSAVPPAVTALAATCVQPAQQ
jgi:hypothetical protein